MKPKRIQRKRTKGWKMPDGAVYVGRPTKWGNPIRVGLDTPSGFDAVTAFSAWITRGSMARSIDLLAKRKPPTLAEILSELRGKDLVCWCRLDQMCHADVLLKIANSEPAATPLEVRS